MNSSVKITVLWIEDIFLWKKIHSLKIIKLMPGVTGALPPVNKSKDTDRSGRCGKFSHNLPIIIFFIFFRICCNNASCSQNSICYKVFYHCQQRITRLIELLNLFPNEKILHIKITYEMKHKANLKCVM